jgi:VIT1/CCC1 family predicted Fe2+/Mn2+ transporter
LGLRKKLILSLSFLFCFFCRFELGLEKPNPRRALRSALTIAGSYVAGGLVPLVPYMVLESTRLAFGVSAAFTLAALLGFGFAKGRLFGTSPARSAVQTALVGATASAAAFLASRAIQSQH